MLVSLHTNWWLACISLSVIAAAFREALQADVGCADHVREDRPEVCVLLGGWRLVKAESFRPERFGVFPDCWAVMYVVH